jgi:hypothetical protein
MKSLHSSSPINPFTAFTVPQLLDCMWKNVKGHPLQRFTQVSPTLHTYADFERLWSVLVMYNCKTGEASCACHYTFAYVVNHSLLYYFLKK